MKQKKEAIILAVLVALAAIVWYFNRTSPVATAGPVAGNVNYQPLPVENSQIQWWKLEASRKADYTGRRNIFSSIAPPSDEEVKKAADAQKAQQAQQQGPLVPAMPVVSPLPVKFFGYGMLPSNGPRLAFFTDGEDVFIVGEGEMLMGRFRVLRIGNSSLEYEEVGSGLRGTTTMEDQGPTA